MAYNSYSDIEKIVGLKSAYDEAKKNNDQQGMNTAANSAQQYYSALERNGYGDVAKQLKSSGYSDAQKIKTAAGTKGKTAIRPYLYNLAKQYGMNEGDVSNALSYNESTGEVSLGGKNIGTPYANVDGTTYWDADKLSNAWDDYTASMGIAKTPEVQYSQGTQNVQTKLNDVHDLAKSDHDNLNSKYDRLEKYGYSNPYDTDIADSIMEDYKWKGAQASDEAIASGSSSNGGNIDSYSAANASRQQLAFTNAGKAAVLNDFNARLANIQNILSSLGAYNQSVYDTMHQNTQLDMQNNQQIFDNNETQKANDFAREAQVAEITGYVPQSWSDSQNPFLDEYGNPINADGMDYKAIINNAQAEYERTGDTSLLKTIEYANAARNKKISNNFAKYGQYSDNMTVPVSQTAAVTQANADRDANKQIALDTNYTSRYNTENTNEANKYISDNSRAASKYEIDENAALQKWLAANGYTSSSSKSSGATTSSKSSSTTSSSSNSKATEAMKNEADKQVSAWLYSVAGLDDDDTFRGYDGSANVQYVAAEKISDSEIVQAIKDTLISQGYSMSEADNKISEYKENIAKQIAQIEGVDPANEENIKEIYSRYKM